MISAKLNSVFSMCALIMIAKKCTNLLLNKLNCTFALGSAFAFVVHSWVFLLPIIVITKYCRSAAL